MSLIIEAIVLRLVKDGLEELTVTIAIALLAARLAVQIVIDRLVEQRLIEQESRDLFAHGKIVVVLKLCREVTVKPVHRNVVRVDEGGDRQPRRVAVRGIKLFQQFYGLTGYSLIAALFPPPAEEPVLSGDDPCGSGPIHPEKP
jgi:hypothetical protein